MFTKEPTETRDLGLDWSDWLVDINGNPLTISTSTWTGPAGITIVDDDIQGSTTIVRVSSGTWAETYELSNTIVASNGESETRTLLIHIQRSVAYCTPTEVRRRATQATLNSLPAEELEALIEQGSRLFDRVCGVPDGYFNGVRYPIATTKTFYGDGTNYLRIDPYKPGSLNTSLTLPSGVTQPDFVERNGYLVITTSTGYGPPFQNFYSSQWPGWERGMPITISAIWGFEDSDAAVKLAVIELVINLWRETDPAQVKLVNIEGQPLREKLPPRVQLIANKYKARRVAFI